MAIYKAYATTSDLATFLFTTTQLLSSDASRLLARASELIKQVTLSNIESDSMSATVKADNLEAAKLAVCAQVEYWLELGGQGMTLVGQVKSYDAGDIKMTFDKPLTYLAPRAKAYLSDRGLLYRGIRSVGSDED